MICECGFKFSGAGEFRNCNAFIDQDGNSGIVCPTCRNRYVNVKGVWYNQRYGE
jgi:hypothetical protein